MPSTCIPVPTASPMSLVGALRPRPMPNVIGLLLRATGVAVRELVLDCACAADAAVAIARVRPATALNVRFIVCRLLIAVSDASAVTGGAGESRRMHQTAAPPP